eukprot:347073-Chlamydomonas_euryale.AAC.2
MGSSSTTAEQAIACMHAWRGARRTEAWEQLHAAGLPCSVHMLVAPAKCRSVFLWTDHRQLGTTLNTGATCHAHLVVVTAG